MEAAREVHGGRGGGKGSIAQDLCGWKTSCRQFLYLICFCKGFSPQLCRFAKRASDMFPSSIQSDPRRRQAQGDCMQPYHRPQVGNTAPDTQRRGAFNRVTTTRLATLFHIPCPTRCCCCWLRDAVLLGSRSATSAVLHPPRPASAPPRPLPHRPRAAPSHLITITVCGPFGPPCALPFNQFLASGMHYWDSCVRKRNRM